MERDPTAFRDRFPALLREMGGRPVVYADAPGGTQVPASVIEAMGSYLATSNANRAGAFVTSEETDRIVARARSAASDFLGCRADEVVFGPNMTTLAFSLSRSLAGMLGPGDEVVVTRLDHDGNISPWLAAAGDSGATIRWVGVREDVTLDLDELASVLGERTRIVAFTLASNAVGSVTDGRKVVELVRETNAIAVADAVHLAPHRAIDFPELGADVIFCSPYKFFGPHLGVMAARRELLEAWTPYKVRPADDTVPERWETGTQSHEALAGLVAAIDYLAEVGRECGRPEDGSRRASVLEAADIVVAHEAELSRRFLAGIAGVPRIRLHGIGEPDRADERTPTFALTIDGRSPREVAEELARRGVFVWDGNYYALAVMQALGLEDRGGAVRVGFCHYATTAEVDRVVADLRELAR